MNKDRPGLRTKVSSSSAQNLDDMSPADVEDQAPAHHGKEPAKLWGFELRMSERHLAMFLAGGALFTYLGFTAVQEGVFRTADFKYGGMVTLCTSSIYCISAGLERVRNGEGLTRKGSWRDYIILALMTSTGMYMTNAALMYLNYTTRIVAKSSKVIPTMILGTVMQGRRYNVDEYSAAGLLVLGIILFTMGDVESLPSFNPKGVVLIMIALCLDSAAGNFEERRFFNVPNPVSHAEVVYHANLIGMCFTVTAMFASGELFEALHHAVTHTAIIPSIATAAVFGYLSVSFILLLIRQYGATNTEIVKSLRKMVSIAASLVLYPKPMGWKYVAGCIATALGLLALYTIKRRKLMLMGSLEAAK